ncbi:hypothetical protein LCGC14_2907480 [marine sediment metagenome]|uniref:Uncharacterized protein n=1 Tax=marine sediment metagenome TaxID=412755 RepID=A0A0F9A0A5_9ZZZZ
MSADQRERCGIKISGKDKIMENPRKFKELVLGKLMVESIHKSLYKNLEFILFNIETGEGIEALDLALEVYKRLGYPMNDFLDNYWDGIENRREIYGDNNGK